MKNKDIKLEKNIAILSIVFVLIFVFTIAFPQKVNIKADAGNLQSNIIVININKNDAWYKKFQIKIEYPSIEDEHKNYYSYLHTSLSGIETQSEEREYSAEFELSNEGKYKIYAWVKITSTGDKVAASELETPNIDTTKPRFTSNELRLDLAKDNPLYLEVRAQDDSSGISSIDINFDDRKTFLTLEGDKFIHQFDLQNIAIFQLSTLTITDKAKNIIEVPISNLDILKDENIIKLIIDANNQMRSASSYRYTKEAFEDLKLKSSLFSEAVVSSTYNIADIEYAYNQFKDAYEGRPKSSFTYKDTFNYTDISVSAKVVNLSDETILKGSIIEVLLGNIDSNKNIEEIKTKAISLSGITSYRVYTFNIETMVESVRKDNLKIIINIDFFEGGVYNMHLYRHIADSNILQQVNASSKLSQIEAIAEGDGDFYLVVQNVSSTKDEKGVVIGNRFYSSKTLALGITIPLMVVLLTIAIVAILYRKYK